MSNPPTQSLEQYLKEHIDNGNTFHWLKAATDANGHIMFYIMAAAGEDADGLSFLVFDNALAPTPKEPPSDLS